MNPTPQRTFLHPDPEPDPRSSPKIHLDFRTQLNNWLQVNGGTERLDWKSFRVGPENDPTWTAVCLSEYFCKPPSRYRAESASQ